jgi:predicted SnoaL-like aldol condensation-catalyzing enzyme
VKIKRSPLAAMAAATALFLCACAQVPATAPTAQQEANRQAVLAFYEKGLNQKDADAALQYVGNRYVQHNPTAADGPEGFRKFIAFLREKFPNSRSVIKRSFVDGDYVSRLSREDRRHHPRRPGARHHAQLPAGARPGRRGHRAAAHRRVPHGRRDEPVQPNLRDQAQHAKTGIYAAGGTPHECPVVSVSDGLTMAHSGMRFSLISRELIADSVEASTRGHQWDGIFAIGACDKNLPGLMMGMVRCNVPGVFVHGGSALPGQMDGRDVNVVDTYETIGKVLAGTATPDDLDAMSRACLPTAGACAGQFTANTMGMVSRGAGPGAHRLVDGAGGVQRARAADAPRRRALMGGDGRRPAAARHRHAQGAGERLRRGLGHRRLDQRGAAPAGHRARGRHQVPPRRRRRSVRAHPAHRRPEAGRPVPGARRVLRRRRARSSCANCSHGGYLHGDASPTPAARWPRN